MVNGLDQGDRRALFQEAVLDTGYWPGRGIVYSLLFHTMAFSAALYLSVSGALSQPQFRREARPLEDRLDLTEVVYLPVLSGGDSGQAAGDLGEGLESPSVAGSTPPEGLAYPGPQEILSEFPDPTNSFQTVLRPALEAPEVLEPSLGVPNLIQLEDTAVVQAEAPSREVLVAPVLEASNETAEDESEPEDLPRIDLDAQARADLAALAAELDTIQPLPVESVPVALAERAVEPVQAADLSVLAADRNPLQALPARQVDMALPMRTLMPTEPVELAELAAERAAVQPLPVRESDLVLPTRALAPLPARPEDVSRLAPGRESVQPLPVRESDLVLPTRALAPVPATSEALNELAAAQASFEALPVEQVEVGLPNRNLEPNRPAELPQLAGAPARPPRGSLPVGPMPVARPRPAMDLPRIDVADGSAGRTLEDILALSPMPASERGPLPVGELRGTFAISTSPNLETSETRPGARVDEPVAGDESAASLSDFLASNAGEGAAPEAGGGVDVASGGGGEAIATGRGVDPEPGSGSGAGSNAFPGITILAGGTEPPASARDTGLTVTGGLTPTASAASAGPGREAPEEEREAAPGHLQTSYGVTLLTTESGGGGLPDFGVFSDEQVHTVFFDMRRRASDETPPWTVEYGVPQGTRVESSTAGHGGEIVSDFVLPFPIDRAEPRFPPQIVERFPGQVVIAYAVINADGKPEEISVKQSPDPRLVQPVYDALAQWTFRAARLDGAAVAVKMLVGIPLWR